MDADGGSAASAWLAWRLERAPGLADLIAILGPANARVHHARAWKDVERTPVELVDLRGLGHEAGARALALGAIVGDEDVVVTYAAEPDHALFMAWGTFVRFWDDVWYPASDDIRVLSVAGEFVVEIDHDEQLRVNSDKRLEDHESGLRRRSP